MSIIYFILLLFNNFCLASTSTQNISIISQQTHGFSQQLINHLVTDISKAGYLAEKKILDPELIQKLKKSQPLLLIAVGSNITRQLLEADINTPILSILMPENIAETLKKLYPKKTNWSSLLINQPLKRQFLLISAILGKNIRTGVILGPSTESEQQALKDAATITNHKLRIKKVTNPENLSNSINSLQRISDVLLTLPDPLIYNRKTIRGILLSSYRARLPIIGFSKSYVKAGAIAALYSKPRQISQQTTKIIRDYLKENSFKKVFYYPNSFSVALNNKVAHSLSIKLDKRNVIISRIKRDEKTQ